jgi:hypothetical protein
MHLEQQYGLKGFRTKKRNLADLTDDDELNFFIIVEEETDDEDDCDGFTHIPPPSLALKIALKIPSKLKVPRLTYRDAILSSTDSPTADKQT